MPVYVRLARSLYELRDVTASELAAHAGVGRAAAKTYLHQRNGTLVQPVGSAPATGRGRPATRWRLTEEGASRLRADLKEFLIEDPSSVDERAAAAARLRAQVEQLLAELASFADEAATVPEAEWSPRESWLRQRIRAVMIALGDLGGLATLQTETAALAQAGALLDQLRSQRLERANVPREAQGPVDAYLADWIEVIRDGLAPIVRLETILSAGSNGAAPILVLDGLRRSSRLRNQMREAGAAVGSPVFRIPMAQLSEEDAATVANRIAEHMRFAAGSATQIVAALDSRDSANRSKVTNALISIQEVRGEAGMHVADFEHPVLAERADELLYKVGAAFSLLAVTSAAAGGRPVVPVGVLLIVGALSRARIGSQFDDSCESQPPHIPLICIDVDQEDALADICAALNVRYIPQGGAVDFSLPTLQPPALVTTPARSELADCPLLLATA